MAELKINFTSYEAIMKLQELTDATGLILSDIDKEVRKFFEKEGVDTVNILGSYTAGSENVTFEVSNGGNTYFFQISVEMIDVGGLEHVHDALDAMWEDVLAQGS
ncbi:MAG: hypothetical protein ACXAEN_19435 [Candidatus Thorarchaeota archaeon]|jgi:hypothetical protein